METQQKNSEQNPSRLCLVTPCLNAAAYLEQTLHSVIDQPGFGRVDYIVMDGGSTDGTLEILECHKSRFHFFRSAPDAGLYHAVEQGFSHSDAEIMGWLNADDMLCPWTLRLVLRIFEQLPEVSFITSRFPLIMDKEGVAYRADQLPGVTRADVLAGLTLPEKGRSALNFISQESTFWRRSLWEQAGSGFDHSLKLACDFELWSRFLQHTELHVVDVPMAMFRAHGANLSIRQAGEYIAEAKRVLSRQADSVIFTETWRHWRMRELIKLGMGFVTGKIYPESAKPVRISFDESRRKHFATRKSHREGVRVSELSGAASKLIVQITEEESRLVSFDVFDTLLWRPCRRPVDLFHRLGEILHASGHLSGIEPAVFAKRRIEAELAARLSSVGPEVRHLEILSKLSAQLGRPDEEVLAEAEYLLEREHLFAYLEMFQLLERLGHEGIPYALCSDMYFSSAQIRSFLQNAAERLKISIPEPMAVLVSGDHRTGKSDRLFDLLVEKTGIPAAHILHIGDNPVSDVAKPRAKGIRSIHLPRTCDMAEAILDAEEKYLVAGKNFQIDFGLAATRKELLAESMAANNGKISHRAYGAFVAGPVFAAFAAWVALECHRQGIRRVDCILREGHFLSRLLDKANAILGVDLDARTILSSRFCLRAAGLVDATEEGLVDFLRNVRPLDVQADLFEYLGLFEKSDSAEWLQQAMDTAEWSDRVGYALRVFRDNPAAAARVSRLAAQRKQGLLAYLRGRGLRDGEEMVFVDLGWGGTMQTCSLPFLRELGFTGAARGFYLGTDHRIERLSPVDCPWQSLLYRAGQPLDEARFVQRTPELLEQFCMSPHGSLLEFQPNGEPLFHANRLPEPQIRETAEIQEGILDFTARWLPRYLQSGGRTDGGQDLQKLTNCLRAVISRSIDAPRSGEVVLFADWRHDSNNGSEDCRSLLGDPDTIERVKSGLVTHPSQLDWLRSYWPQGLFTHLELEWDRRERPGRLARGVKFLVNLLPGGKFTATRLLGFWKKLRPRLGMARFRFRVALARWRWSAAQRSRCSPTSGD